MITDEGEGGVYHDMKYDVEFMNGDFEHLALVENPRYEEATIVLNSKGESIRKKKINETQDDVSINFLLTEKKEFKLKLPNILYARLMSLIDNLQKKADWKISDSSESQFSPDIFLNTNETVH